MIANASADMGTPCSLAFPALNCRQRRKARDLGEVRLREADEVSSSSELARGNQGPLKGLDT